MVARTSIGRQPSATKLIMVHMLSIMYIITKVHMAWNIAMIRKRG